MSKDHLLNREGKRCGTGDHEEKKERYTKPTSSGHEKFDREKLLPINKGDFPFVPPKNKEGKIPKGKEGRFIDKKGNVWKWDHINYEWDVKLKHSVNGRAHENVSPDGYITHNPTDRKK